MRTTSGPMAQQCCCSCVNEDDMIVAWKWFEQWSDQQRRMFLEKLVAEATPDKLAAKMERLMSPQPHFDGLSQVRTFEDQVAFIKICISKWTVEKKNHFIHGLEAIDESALNTFYKLIANLSPAMNIECVIRHKNAESRHTAHVHGRGREYLSSLSEQLNAIQSKVNAVLTELVDDGKRVAQVAVDTQEADSDNDDGEDEDEDMKPEPKKAKT